jgi:hypothetical protein
VSGIPPFCHRCPPRQSLSVTTLYVFRRKSEISNDRECSAFAAVDLGSGEWPLSSRLLPLSQSEHRLAVSFIAQRPVSEGNVLAELDLDVLMNVVDEQTKNLPRNQPFVFVPKVLSYREKKIFDLKHHSKP